MRSGLFSGMAANQRKIIKLFEDKKINFVLFKSEHNLRGSNKNLDVLLSSKDYRSASILLKQQGFALYLPEKIEKYKRMFVNFEKGIVTAIHLHREVAWHGLRALDKKNILRRAKDHLPSPEDSLLIHAAHGLFENFQFTAEQKKLLESYSKKCKDWIYVRKQAHRYGWGRLFLKIVKKRKVERRDIFFTYLSRVIYDPLGVLYFKLKVIKKIIRALSLRRQGHLIALIGVNGAGKSTVKKNLLEEYAPLTAMVSGQQGFYYGWKQSGVSKIMAKTVNVFSRKKKDQNLFQKVSDEKVKRFDTFQELLFIYNYGSYLWRYLIGIYPQLRKGKLVVTDRYYYDLYGQYPYSKNSWILPLLPFPKPDAVFLLDADIATITRRDKEGYDQRVLQPVEKLEGQRRRYHRLAERRGFTAIDNSKDLQKNIDIIIKKTWGAYLNKKR
ncbi:hypothetical protein COV20_03790 [Candidatus Woesearchaeota archaeon CG10_big_fil_rev_8_21_14_0_10_45_16]|nr:MAG: hypothetical protein COV20_03790 [Candidatus Woesearchaeota archaeon CG10_big_fil_rev_8_21_14_0_10_45_16]